MRIQTQNASQSHSYCYLKDIWILKSGCSLKSPTHALVCWHMHNSSGRGSHNHHFDYSAATRHYLCVSMPSDLMSSLIKRCPWLFNLHNSRHAFCALKGRWDRHWWICCSVGLAEMKNGSLPCYVQESNLDHPGVQLWLLDLHFSVLANQPQTPLPTSTPKIRIYFIFDMTRK